MSLEHPPYWYVYVPRPTDGPLEVAAIAPTFVRRDLFGRDAQILMRTADEYVTEFDGRRVVFAGELTLWLATHRRTWWDIGADFEEAIGEIEDKAPALYIQVNQIAYSAVGDTSRTRHEIRFADGTRINLKEHLEPVRSALLDTIERDWSTYARTFTPS